MFCEKNSWFNKKDDKNLFYSAYPKLINLFFKKRGANCTDIFGGTS